MGQSVKCSIQLVIIFSYYCPVVESVHSALVSAVKAEMSDLMESLALKSIQKALTKEFIFVGGKIFL